MSLDLSLFKDYPQLAVLIDPDKTNNAKFTQLLDTIHTSPPDLIFVGGSSETTPNLDGLVANLKKCSSSPVILFPGSEHQISHLADGILVISLISGRNADYLIGKHVKSALDIIEARLHTIPVGYILVDGGTTSSTSKLTATDPISRNNHDLIVRTAVAGQLLGMKSIYLEAGSGANIPVPKELIRMTKKHIDIPLMVGGGIKNENDLLGAIRAGADTIIIGTAFEEAPSHLEDFVDTIKKFR